MISVIVSVHYKVDNRQISIRISIFIAISLESASIRSTIISDNNMHSNQWTKLVFGYSSLRQMSVKVMPFLEGCSFDALP